MEILWKIFEYLISILKVLVDYLIFYVIYIALLADMVLKLWSLRTTNYKTEIL